MKKTLILLFFIQSIFAQQKGIIYYGFIDAKGVGRAKGPDSNAYLVFNKEQSYFVTAKDSLEKVEKANEQQTFLNDDNDSDIAGHIYNGMKVSAQGDQVVYNIKSKTINSSFKSYSKQVYITEPVTKFNWKIENETKKIGKFICKKASVNFRGRNYIAWFTPEISVQYGPWKLNGLPGLILEAYDTTKEVSWYFKSVEYPTKNKEKVNNVRKTVKEGKIKFLTIDEFKEFCLLEREKMYERTVMMKKQHPEFNIILQKSKMSEIFIEVFE